MTLDASLATAISGLRVSQQGLSSTAHNIANVNTPGYIRKIASQEAVVLGGRGAGAATSDIERVIDRFLHEEVRSQTSETGASETIARYHDRLQTFLSAPGEDADLATRLGEFGVALEELANSPDSSAVALEVVHLGRSLGSSLDQLAGQVQRLRADADREIGQTVAEVNQSLTSIAILNTEIAALAAGDQPTAELADQRDAAIANLASMIDISTYDRGDGVVVVQTGRGDALADTTAQVLHYEPAASITRATVFGRISIHSPSELAGGGTPTGGTELVSAGIRADAVPEVASSDLITSRIDGGRLAGLVEARDRVFPGFADQIEELAGALRYTVNAAHNDAVAIPPPATLSGTRTDFSDFAAGSPSGLATLAVIEPDGSTTVAFQIDLSTAATIEDVRSAINAGFGGLGSATYTSDGALEIALADPDRGIAFDEGTSALDVTDAAGRSRTYGLSHYLGLNDFFVLERADQSSLTVRSDLVGTPARVGTARLDVSTGPLTATLGASGDDRGVRGLADALTQQQAVITRGSLPAGDVTVAGYASQIIADAAVVANQAGEAAERDQALAEALRFRAEATSGVNVDEEMTRMIQIQNAYTASARVISVTEEMFDELFRIAG